MKHFLFLLLACSVSAIWPQPSAFMNGTGVLWFSADTPCSFNGSAINTTWDGTGTTVFPGLTSAQDLSLSIIHGAVQRAYRTILAERFVPWKLHKSNTQWEPLTVGNSKIQKIDISTTTADTNVTFKPKESDVDEKYILNVTADGNIIIRAVSTIGVLRALDSMTQLFYTHSTSPTMSWVGAFNSMPIDVYKTAIVYTNMAPVTLMDTPAFGHRGLNLDVARSFFPVTDIQRTIDALAFNKFNRLHIHATDSQAWPLEILSLSQLTNQGPYGPNQIYRNSDLKLIQQYGQYRGVEVIIEIDMPGHTASIAKAYPSVIACYNEPNWPLYAAEPPSGQLKLNFPGASMLIQLLLTDILPNLVLYSSYFHMGGDEVNANCYSLDPDIRSNDTQVIRPLLQAFVEKNIRQVIANEMTPILWEEMLLDWNLKLPQEVVIQTWRNDSSVQAVTRSGHKAIVGNFNYWYLDCGRGQWLNFAASEDAQYWPYPDYCSPTKNWRLMYSYDPLSGVDPQYHKLVIGGEVHLWTETVDTYTLDSTLWPRASAAGEILWSGAKDAAGRNRSQIEASPRLAEMRERMVSRGVTAGVVQMVFCTQGNGSTCSLYSTGGHGSSTNNVTSAVSSGSPQRTSESQAGFPGQQGVGPQVGGIEVNGGDGAAGGSVGFGVA